VAKKPKAPRTASQRGKHAHRKGAKGELEVIKYFAQLGFKGKRRPQYRGGVKDGPDVRCTHHTGIVLGVESKLDQKISVHAVINQAKEAVQDGGEFAVGYMRRDREEGIVVMPASTFAKLFLLCLPRRKKNGWPR